MTTRKQTKPKPRTNTVTLDEVNEFKRVMEVVARWIQSVPRPELSSLAMIANKETAVFEALKALIERVLECNDAVVSRIATTILSDVVNAAKTKTKKPAEATTKNLVKSKRRAKNAC